jgi:hypothetical protein
MQKSYCSLSKVHSVSLAAIHNSDHVTNLFEILETNFQCTDNYAIPSEVFLVNNIQMLVSI